MLAIKFFESKKHEYAVFAGSVYKIAEVFIEGGVPDLKDDQINGFVQEFTKKIDAHIGKDLVDILTSDFTTTTQNEKIASQIINLPTRIEKNDASKIISFFTSNLVK